MRLNRKLSIVFILVAFTHSIYATEVTANDSAPIAVEQSTTTTTTSTIEKKLVNLNEASLKQLIKIKGINTGRARAIIAYRKRHGDFTSVDEIINVNGFKKIRPALLAQIKAQLTVDNQ